jgi:hypothetical protein
MVDRRVELLHHVHMIAQTGRPTPLTSSRSGPLLGGRTRVELSAEEAVRAIHWAAQQDGWDDHELPPLFVYPPLVAGEG